MSKSSGGTRGYSSTLREYKSSNNIEYEASNGSTESIASESIRDIIELFNKQKYTPLSYVKIGDVESEVIEFCNDMGIELASNELYFSSDRITHAIRDSKKKKNIAVQDSELIDFPDNRKTMNIYYDRLNKNFLYVSDKGKFVIHPNYKVKMSDNNGKRKNARIVNLITASKLGNKELFKEKKYTKIK